MPYLILQISGLHLPTLQRAARKVQTVETELQPLQAVGDVL